MSERIPPQNLDCESHLLGALILEPEYIDDVADRIAPTDFYSAINAEVYSCILAVAESGLAGGKIAVVEELRRRNRLNAVGGPQYLSSLTDTIVTEFNVDYYARIIAEKATMRRMIGAGSRIIEIGFDESSENETAIAEAMAVLDAVKAPTGSVTLTTDERVSMVIADLKNPGQRKRISSPWPKLDEKTGGFFPNELYMVVGSPKAGKTNFELSLAHHIGITHGYVAIFAIEMGVYPMTERQLAFYSGQSVASQRAGLTPYGLQRILEEEHRIRSMPLDVFDSDVRSIPTMRRHLRRAQRTQEIQAIFVDHVGLMSEVASGGRESKVERLERTYGQLRDIAAEFRAPMFAIQHLNRQASMGAPTAAQIRDGGNPDGLAAATLIVHREDPMNEAGNAHLGELRVASSRWGQAGIVPMTYDGVRGQWLERTKFNAAPVSADWDQGHYDYEKEPPAEDVPAWTLPG